MLKGFARLYILILSFVFLLFVGVVAFSNFNKIFGLVLGAKDKRENVFRVATPSEQAIKVLVVSPDYSWDLSQYLCQTYQECEKSISSGKWWATISGGPTNQEGHEVYIEKSQDWGDYKFLKLVVKQVGLSEKYLKTLDGASSFIVDLNKNDGFREHTKFF